MGHHNTPKRKYKTPVPPQSFRQLPLFQKIMTVLLWIVVSIILLATLVGCSGKQKLTENIAYKHDTTVVTIRKVDTLITKEPDTASMRLLAECDENGRALLSIIDNMKGERVSITPEIRYVSVRDTSGMVKVSAYATLQAIADGFAEKISILEAQVQKGNEEKQTLSKELNKTSYSWFAWLMVGFVIGIIALCLIKLVLK